MGHVQKPPSECDNPQLIDCLFNRTCRAVSCEILTPSLITLLPRPMPRPGTVELRAAAVLCHVVHARLCSSNWTSAAGTRIGVRADLVATCLAKTVSTVEPVHMKGARLVCGRCGHPPTPCSVQLVLVWELLESCGVSAQTACSQGRCSKRGTRGGLS